MTLGPNPDSTDRVLRIIRDVGFPVAVATYLLVRLDILIRDNTAALWALERAVRDLIKATP